MKTGIFLLLLLTLQITVSAQWQQTNGIKGAYYTNAGGAGDVIITSTSYGTILRKQNGEWQQVKKLPSSPDNILRVNLSWIMISGNLFYRSDDDGINWVEKQLPFYPQRDIVYRDSLLYGFNTDTAFISTDLGESWQKEAAAGNLTFTDSTGFIHEGFIYAPQNVHFYGGSIYVVGFSTIPGFFSGIFKRAIGDTTWQVIIPPDNLSTIFSCTFYQNALYISTTSGIYRSAGEGGWESINQGLPVSPGISFTAQSMRVAEGRLFLIVNTNPSGLYFYEDNQWISSGLPGFPSSVEINDGNIYASSGGFLYAKAQTGDWQTLGQEVIASTSIPVPLNKDTVFSIYRGNLYRTLNGGNDWYAIDSGKSQLTIGKNKHLYAIGTSGLYTSASYGNDWQLINGNLPASYTEKSSIVIEKDGILFAGFNGTRARMHLPPVWEQGGIYRSLDNGISWQSYNSGLPFEGNVPVPVYNISLLEDMLLIRTYRGYYILRDGTWTSVDAVMPPGSYIRDLKYFENNLIVLTYKGCYTVNPNTLQLDSINTGLPFNNGSTSYTNLFIYNDSLYAFGRYGTESVLRFETQGWAASEFEAERFNNFTAVAPAGSVLYAGTYDMGIWKYGDDVFTSVQDGLYPSDIILEQNYPNPFNPVTTIRYSIPNSGSVKLVIYDMLGNEIKTAVNDYRNAGNHEFSFDGSEYSSGVYIYRLYYGGLQKSRKFILLK